MEAARPATDADLPDLCALAALAREDLTPTRGGELYLARDAVPLVGERTFSTRLEDPHHFVVVGTVEGATVGYGTIHLETLRDGDRLAVVDELFVLPGARGVGVGEAMMDMLVAYCEGNDCLGIDATVLPGDRHTKNFFETFGLVARAIVVHRALRAPHPKG